MSVVLSLKTFSIKLRGLRVWKAYDVGPAGKCFTLHTMNGFGRLQELTDRCVEQPLTVLRERLLL